jgi:thiosulfate/3-mercaptopyruvate sulfurtransferase
VGIVSSSLVSVPELHEELGDVALFDVRWSLADPHGGRDAYRAGHVPGAVFVDLEGDLCGPRDGGGRHPLPAPGAFAATLGRLGLTPRSDVVVYDDSSGAVASRMWWMLRSIGHRGGVRILDGGWRAWHEAGFDIETGDVVPAAGAYPPPPHGFAGVAPMEAIGSTANQLLLDARSPERFRGEHEPVDPRAGHIPGAVNLPWQSLVAPDGRMRDATDLRRRLTALGADRRPVVVSCGSGVTSCHLALALELAGLPRPLLYVGSFSEWARTDRRVEGGE